MRTLTSHQYLLLLLLSAHFLPCQVGQLLAFLSSLSWLFLVSLHPLHCAAFCHSLFWARRSPLQIQSCSNLTRLLVSSFMYSCQYAASSFASPFSVQLVYLLPQLLLPIWERLRISSNMSCKIAARIDARTTRTTWTACRLEDCKTTRTVTFDRS